MQTVDSRDRNRLVLLLVVAAFALPLAAAFVLRSSDWRPQSTTSSGMLVDPPRDLTGIALKLADGSAFDWHDPHFRWTLLALPGARCATACRERLDEALRMRITLGRNAERLRVLYVGPALEPEFTAQRAPLQIAGDAGAFSGERAHGDDALALALVDPNGRLMLVYPDGYSAQGLRRDITKILY
jgi:cytochrome oxidase Cu insertion factor (SCO1/SenC/PrrC family)